MSHSEHAAYPAEEGSRCDNSAVQRRSLASLVRAGLSSEFMSYLTSALHSRGDGPTFHGQQAAQFKSGSSKKAAELVPVLGTNSGSISGFKNHETLY